MTDESITNIITSLSVQCGSIQCVQCRLEFSIVTSYAVRMRIISSAVDRGEDFVK